VKICYKSGDANAFDNLSERQPDTGHKIRKDANVATSMVLTLPRELGEEDVDAWAQARPSRALAPGGLSRAAGLCHPAPG